MKVLISFRVNHKFDNFEGARVRKSIKGALELNEQAYTTSSVDYYDVAHLIKPESENKITSIQDNGVPVIVSALYAEDDPTASYLTHVKKNGAHLSTINVKNQKFLNKADLILVPCESNVDLLRKNGITSKIKVCYPGVNLSRFDYSREDEKDIFYRYYAEDKNKKLVIAVGEYDSSMDGISSFITAAKKCPNAIFYYIGRVKGLTNFRFKVNRLFRSAPKNVHFVDVPPDDVYRSALLNASVFMLPGYKIAGVTSLAEAMAAKTQIIARKCAIYPGFLEDGVTAHLAEFSETLSSLTRDFLEGKITPTTANAYKAISEHSLTDYGKGLIDIYQEVIKDNTHRRI
mgnify:CR=1 FL=1